ncbi:MAG: helix-turn-helix transcriptional regulator [Candidatus Margulisbacteria bacterium]|nr:helix-turn-helix transcriptional regulator [Candidatus Margulisiibacteriota bacterium]
MSIGNKIREERRKANLTQGELANRAGMTTTTIFKIEKSITDPKWSTVTKIAAALEIPTASLL